jgi:hypothetical protein
LGIHYQITFFAKTSGFFRTFFFQFNSSITKLDEISFEIIAKLPNKKKDDNFYFNLKVYFHFLTLIKKTGERNLLGNTMKR